MDDTFGPRLQGHFDFTLLFEHSIFHILPSGLFLVSLPFFIPTVARGEAIVRPGLLLWVKLAIALALCGVQLANVVFWYKSQLGTSLAQAAAVLPFFSYIGVGFMAYGSHVHHLQPIVILSAYLSGTMLLDLVTIYTYFNRDGLDTIATVTCVLPPLKFALVALEEFSKRQLIISDELRENVGSEVLAGFWSRSSFAWINPLLLFGFRNRIRNDNLPDIGHQFDSQRLYQAFKTSWDRRDRTKKHALLKACIAAMPWPFVHVILPRLLLVGFLFAQLFLLQEVVNLLSGSLNDDIPRTYRETGLILATAIIFVGKAMSQNWFTHTKNQILISIKSMLTSAIFHKSFRLSSTDIDPGRLIALMTADVEGVERFIDLAYDSWATVLQLAIGIALLSVFVGAAVIFAIILAIFVTIASRYTSRRLGETRKRWNEKIEDRVSHTSNILAQIKDIKMAGLAPSMAVRLKQLHDKEIEVALKNRKALSFTFGMCSFTEMLTPALVIAGALFWTKARETMSVARFYTTLAVLTYVADPLAMFLRNLPEWSAGFACLGRIQAFLDEPEHEDPRQILPPPAAESEGLRNRHARAPAPPFAARLSDINVSTDLSGSILRNASLFVKPGEVTMLHGRVGCGKTTLLRALLGELRLRNGSSVLASLSVAYAAQKPWLVNATIRLNIIGQKVYNHELYQRIILICDLAIDFNRLPNGDLTIVGSGGILLSGGQQQRISLARALYIEADFTILDDPFSSLDKITAQSIRIRLFSDGNATLNGRTLLMTTSMQQHLVDADTVFRVTDLGQVQYESPADVERNLQRLIRQNREQPVPRSTDEQSTDVKFEPPTVDLSSHDDSYLQDSANPGHSSLSLYWYFLKPAGFLRVSAWLLFTLWAALGERMPNVYARIWQGNDPSDYSYYTGYAILCLAYPVAHILSTLIFYYCVNAKTAQAIHSNLVDTTFGATFEFLMGEDIGTALNRFSQDVSMSTQRVPMLMLPTVFRGITVVVDVAVISAGASYAAPVIPLLLVVVVAFQRYYFQTSSQLRILELDTSKRLMRHVSESANGMEHIRAFRWQEEFMRDFADVLNVTQRPYYFLLCIQQWLEAVLDYTIAVAAVIIVTFALKFRNTASASSIGLALLTLIGFSEVVSVWIRTSVSMETAFGAVSRVKTYCTGTPQEQYRNVEPVSPNWPTAGRLELNCVSAIYRSMGSRRANAPVNNVTVIASPGEILALVGRTGSGKTTLMLAMLNLLDYTGSISIDEREIGTIPPDVLRSRITTITQGNIHLLGTVDYNLDPFDPSTRPPNTIVTQAMKLDALNRVGLLHIVNARGDLQSSMKSMRFSHGQLRLFQLARAILHQQIVGSRIVLMDEGTAGLDDETERRMTLVLDDAFAGCTRLCISHRTNITMASHRVIALQEGDAVVGNHTPHQNNWTEGLQP